MEIAEQARLVSSLRIDEGATQAEIGILLSVLAEVGAAIELSARDAWKTEMRGPDGRWIGHGAGHATGLVHSTRPDAMHRITPRRHPSTLRERHERRLRENIAQRAHTIAEHEQLRVVTTGAAAAQARALIAPDIAAAQKKQAEQIVKLQRSIRLTNQRLAEVADQKEAKGARLKLAVEGGVTIAGAALAFIEAKYSVPDPAVIFSAMGPLFIQQIIEWAKRL